MNFVVDHLLGQSADLAGGSQLYKVTDNYAKRAR
jgi:hypothetical protein